MPSRLGFPRLWPDGAPAFRRALVLFWTIDAVLLGAFIAARGLVYARTIREIPHLLNIDREYTLPEVFNYLKWALCVLCLVVAFARSRVVLFACLAALFAMLFADDAFLIHETLGWTVAETFGFEPALALDPKHFGEAAVFGAMGTIALGLILVGYRLSPPEHWGFAHRFLTIIAGLAVVGVLFDLIHHMSWELTTGSVRNFVGFALTVMEDGGEMLLASLAAAYSWGAAEAVRPASARSALRPER